MKRIVVIDDEPQFLAYYEKSLGAQGYEVVATRDPRAGLRMVKDNPPALLILDVNMPEMDGFELFRELKKSRQGIPVLFATGYPKRFDMSEKSVAEMWNRDFADGKTDIIYKPFDHRRLQAKVEGLIGVPQENT